MLHTHWFDLGSVQFSSVEHDSMDGITCPGSLDVSGEHVEEVLKDERKLNVMSSHLSQGETQ